MLDQGTGLVLWCGAAPVLDWHRSGLVPTGTVLDHAWYLPGPRVVTRESQYFTALLQGTPCHSATSDCRRLLCH
jgi:hypothetical protein